MQTSSINFNRRKKLSRTIDMTPLIDVVFQLLLFFMLTSAIVVNQGLELKLPESKSSISLPIKPIQIDISSESIIFIDGKESSINSIRDYLIMTVKNPSESQVVLRSDSGVSVATLVSVMDAVKTSGINSISIAANPIENKN